MLALSEPEHGWNHPVAFAPAWPFPEPSVSAAAPHRAGSLPRPPAQRIPAGPGTEPRAPLGSPSPPSSPGGSRALPAPAAGATGRHRSKPNEICKKVVQNNLNLSAPETARGGGNERSPDNARRPRCIRWSRRFLTELWAPARRGEGEMPVNDLGFLVACGAAWPNPSSPEGSWSISQRRIGVREASLASLKLAVCPCGPRGGMPVPGEGCLLPGKAEQSLGAQRGDEG